MRKRIAVLLAVMIGVVCAACPGLCEGSAEGIFGASETLEAPEASGERRLEGPGYDTPEEAVLAYLEAMNRGSAADMLATFAIETYAEHLDAEHYLRRIGAVDPTSYRTVIAGTGAFSRSLAASARYGLLAQYLANWYGEQALHLEGYAKPLNEPGEYDQLMDLLLSAPGDRLTGNVEFVGWVSPAVFPIILYPVNSRNLALQNSYTGADDVTLLGAHIRLNGTDAVQTMSCARYGSHWYNLDLGGLLSSVLGLNMNSAGIAYSEDLGTEVSSLASIQPDPEAVTLMAGWEASGLTGTRWRLVSAEQTVVSPLTVLDQKEGIRETDGLNVWADLRLMHLGAVRLEIHYSPALDEILQTNGYPYVMMGGAWSFSDGELKLDVMRGFTKKDTIDMTGVTCEFGDGTLTLVWPWGLRAVFEPV